MIRNTLLSIHILAIITWIGAGFFELYLGRRFLAAKGTVLEAPFIRIVYGSDLVVFIATIVALLAGVAMAIYEGYWFFTVLWLGIKQAIMLLIIVIVVFIFPTAMKLNVAINLLPAGPGPANDDIRELYRKLEPWYWVMRILAVIAVLLAVWRPTVF
jgi:hypothetical protein